MNFLKPIFPFIYLSLLFSCANFPSSTLESKKAPTPQSYQSLVATSKSTPAATPSLNRSEKRPSLLQSVEEETPLWERLRNIRIPLIYTLPVVAVIVAVRLIFGKIPQTGEERGASLKFSPISKERKGHQQESAKRAAL